MLYYISWVQKYRQYRQSMQRPNEQWQILSNWAINYWKGRAFDCDSVLDPWCNRVCVRFLVFKNSALFSSFPCSSQAWHHNFSLGYDEVDQTDHTFSESISLVLFPRSLCMALCLSLNVSERVQKSSEVSFCHFLPRLAPSRPLFQKIDASKLKPSRRTCHLEHYPFPRGHLFIFWMMVFYVPLLWICAL